MNKKFLIGICKFFVFVFALVLNNKVHSQALLGFPHGQLFTQDTLNFNDDFAVNVTVKNFSSSNSFNGFIASRYSVNGVVQPDTLDYFYMHLAPGDSSTDPMAINHISNLIFTAGDNVVVIWPEALGAQTYDSLTLHVYISSLSAGPILQMNNKVTAFYSNENIYFNYPRNFDPQGTIKIFNSLGALVMTYENSPPYIRSNIFTPGIYFLEIDSKLHHYPPLKFCVSY